MPSPSLVSRQINADRYLLEFHHSNLWTWWVCLGREMTMDNDTFDLEERAYMEARNQVSDEELIARMNSAPDMGGALLVELSNFVSRRVPSGVEVAA